MIAALKLTWTASSSLSTGGHLSESIERLPLRFTAMIGRFRLIACSISHRTNFCRYRVCSPTKRMNTLELAHSLLLAGP